jgi:hypothetical protein
MATTFLLVVFAWIFFRAESIAQAFAIINRIFSPTLFSNPIFPEKGKAMWTILIVVAFMVIEWIGRDAPYALGKLGLGWKRYARYLMYYAIIVAIFYFGGDSQEFIYFQF